MLHIEIKSLLQFALLLIRCTQYVIICYLILVVVVSVVSNLDVFHKYTVL